MRIRVLVRSTRWVWASAFSLAATYAMLFSFFSSRYLDVSVPWVRCRALRGNSKFEFRNSKRIVSDLGFRASDFRAKHGLPWFARQGCPIRKFPDHRLLSPSPRLIAATPRPSSPFGVKASTIYP